MVIRLTPLQIPHRNPNKRYVPVGQPVFQVAMLVFGLAAVVAFIIQARSMGNVEVSRMGSPQNVQALLLDIGATTNRYRDERLAFSIAHPPGWRVGPGKDAYPFDVVFLGPDLMSLSIQVTHVPHENIDDLVGKVRTMEKDFGVDTHMTNISYRGYPALRRCAQLSRVTIHTLDVLAEGNEYHLQVKVPSDIDAACTPIVDALLATFEPVQAIRGDETTL